MNLRNEQLETLLDNEWIYLLVLDPTDSNKIKKYGKNGEWLLVSENANNSMEKRVKVERTILEDVLG